jgi:hypothetical protein
VMHVANTPQQLATHLKVLTHVHSVGACCCLHMQAFSCLVSEDLICLCFFCLSCR